MKFDRLINRYQWFYLFMLWNTWIVGALLRFANLAYLNFLVFDEKYFVEFAQAYLTGDSFFDSHPPLGKYLIALGIWIGDRLPFPHTYIELNGALLSPWSYRWLNAVVGALIPLIIGAIAYQLTQRYSYSVIAALFALTDGLFLVESRHALINIYMVFFGLLGQLCLLLIIRKKHQQSWLLPVFAGINFGAAAAVKWNGLGFLLGAYVLWLSDGLCLIFQQYRKWHQLPKLPKLYQIIRCQLFLSPRSFILFLVVLPTLVYSLSWIPHLQLNPDYGFWQLHQQIFTYHHNLGNGETVHRYCSPWWTWPWTIRPVVYFYQTEELADKSTVIYTVYGMANPILSWLAIAAIGWLTYRLWQSIWIPLRRAIVKIKTLKRLLPTRRTLKRLLLTRSIIDIADRSPGWGVEYYLIVNYLCNWLPWVLVSRCTFLYHYMSAAVFGQLAIAFLVDSWLQTKRRYYILSAIGLIAIVLIAFIFWLPLYLGLPLSPAAWKLRIWFSSWV